MKVLKSFTIDSELLERMQKEVNKSQLVCDLLHKHYDFEDAKTLDPLTKQKMIKLGDEINAKHEEYLRLKNGTA